MEVRTRPGKEEDLAGIVEVYNHYVVHSPATFEVDPVTLEGRRTWFVEHSAGGRHRLFVAEGSDGRILGWATTSRFRERAAYETTVESSIYLRPGSTQHGIGSRLYRELFEAIRDEDIERIVAGMTVPNPASATLHQRFGFRPVGTFSNVGRKFGRYWDVAWLERPRVVSAPPS